MRLAEWAFAATAAGILGFLVYSSRSKAVNYDRLADLAIKKERGESLTAAEEAELAEFEA
jgi:hypothetical protein